MKYWDFLNNKPSRICTHNLLSATQYWKKKFFYKKTNKVSRIIIFAQSALRDTVITKIIIIKCQEYVRTSCCPWCSQGPQIKLFGCLVGSQRWSAWTATKLFLCFVFRSATLVSMGPRLNYLGILFSAILVSMGLRWKCSGTSFSVAVVGRDPRRI